MNSAVLTASLTGRIQFFLLRCVAANYSTTTTATSSCCVHPPFAELLPGAYPGTRPDPTRGGKSKGTSPSGRRGARHFHVKILEDVLLPTCTCGGGPEGCAPMEVPDLHAALPNY